MNANETYSILKEIKSEKVVIREHCQTYDLIEKENQRTTNIYKYIHSFKRCKQAAYNTKPCI